MTSSTGGTGALTLTAQTGFPALSDAVTGTRLCSYAIAEYTNGAKTQLSQAETGIGSYVASTGVLTRTSIKTTWLASGPTYLPKFGTSTAPTAINFGSTASNIDVTISPIVSDTLSSIPFWATSSTANVSDGLGILPANMVGFTSITLATGTVYYHPIYIQNSAFFSQASVRVSTAATAAGGTPSTFSVSIYEIGTDSYPGKRLINFGSLGRLTSTNTTFTSSALSTPIGLPAGWYWQACLWVAGTDTGSPTIRGSSSIWMSMPHGGLLSSGTPIAPITLTSQTALNDPATTPNGNLGNNVYPGVWMK